MKSTKVAVVGASGMLGSMVLEAFIKESKFSLTATVRSEDMAVEGRKKYPFVTWTLLDAETATDAIIANALNDSDWVINNIGIIKPYIHDDNPSEAERAVLVNSRFPHVLSRAASKSGARILQIATDCVYSGNKGAYLENDPQDALDVYGKTKSLGEVWQSNVHHLRCSIIGPEPKAFVSLLEWFRRQPANAKVSGYTNHQWNGVTTLHFARICRGIIEREIALPHTQHIIPSGKLSKADMLRCFAKDYKRDDITITPTEAKTVIDRTLSTNNKELNFNIWKSAGYNEPPTVPIMISEMATMETEYGKN